MRVTVVGAGVVGLTTAWRLAGEGIGVRVVTDRPAEESTSIVAAAIWFPYLAEPHDRVARWGLETFEWLRALAAAEPAAGVSMSLCYGAAVDERRPAWADAVPAAYAPRFVPFDELPEAVRRLTAASPPPGAWRLIAPQVTPALHLPWLRQRLEIEVRTSITNLDAVDGDFVVNCTGPRAGALIDDPELKPTFGQIVAAPPGSVANDYVWADDRAPDAPVYFIPRAGETVLGGSNLAGNQLRGRASRRLPEEPSKGDSPERPWELPSLPEPRAEVGAAIVERFRQAGFEIEPGRSLAGWRPTRSAVRVERDGRVIHNYGHGGAGFTLAYGSAGSVLELLRSV